MAQIKFEKNGQGFYDFDALLEKTNEEFVYLLTNAIEYPKTFKSFREHEQTVRVFEDHTYITAAVVFRTVGDLVRFRKNDSKVEHVIINMDSVKTLVDMFKEVGEYDRD